MFVRTYHALRFGIVALCVLAFAGLANAQTPPVWKATTSYQAGNLVVGSDTNTYRSILASTGHNPVVDADGWWELSQTYVPTTLIVGVKQRFTKIEQAWGFLRHAVIPSSAPVTISLSTQNAAFEEVLTAPINLDHAFGANISIVGDDELTVHVECASGVSAFKLDSNDTFGGLKNMTITGEPAPGETTAISLENGATLYGQDVTIGSFYNGVTLGDGSKLIFVPNGGVAVLDIYNCFNAAAQVETGSYLDVPGIAINTTGTSQYGIYLADKSHASVTGGVHHTTVAAVFATNGSSANIPSSTIDTTVLGIRVLSHSDANAQLTHITSTGVGVEASYGSTVNIFGGGATGTTPYYLPNGVITAGADVDNLGKDGSYIYH